ncbi:hypothetical protein [Nostoc commune]|uniref:hypothetical protein n=1 Tax=Nostoc commune TaxID=1178 RepID=UPI0018C6AC31|nr:hypothetical protein [Nostoc commune]MBG1260629.1 hypothetical protein [Nostoc commune BAE]
MNQATGFGDFFQKCVSIIVSSLCDQRIEQAIANFGRWAIAYSCCAIYLKIISVVTPIISCKKIQLLHLYTNEAITFALC